MRIDWPYTRDVFRYLWCNIFHKRHNIHRAEGGRAYACSKCLVLHKVPHADRHDLPPPRLTCPRINEIVVGVVGVGHVPASVPTSMPVPVIRSETSRLEIVPGRNVRGLQGRDRVRDIRRRKKA